MAIHIGELAGEIATHCHQGLGCDRHHCPAIGFGGYLCAQHRLFPPRIIRHTVHRERNALRHRWWIDRRGTVECREAGIWFFRQIRLFLLKSVTMTREKIIEKTMGVINRLPADKVAEIGNFADFILNKFEEEQLKKGIHSLAHQTTSFDFLSLDEDLYSEEIGRAHV